MHNVCSIGRALRCGVLLSPLVFSFACAQAGTDGPAGNGGSGVIAAGGYTGTGAMMAGTGGGAAGAAQDASPEARSDGAAAEPTLAGKGTGSLACDGKSGYVEIPDNYTLDVDGDWTFEAWFKDETTGGYNHGATYLAAKSDAVEGISLVFVEWRSIKAGDHVNWNTTSVDYELDADAGASSWHHVAATFQGVRQLGDAGPASTATLYIDGTFVATKAVKWSRGTISPFTLCTNGSGDFKGAFWLGKLDDVRFWSVVRTAEQIARYAGQQIEGDLPDLVANWRFDDDAASAVVKDVTRHGHDGVLKPGATFSTDVHP
jgi:hypothetical protein